LGKTHRRVGSEAPSSWVRRTLELGKTAGLGCMSPNSGVHLAQLDELYQIRTTGEVERAYRGVCSVTARIRIGLWW
jgi:hypothetical protein